MPKHAQEPWFKEMKKFRLKNIRDRKYPPHQKEKVKADPEISKILRSKASLAKWQRPEYRANLIRKQVGWRQYPQKLDAPNPS